jgi:CHASE1-domain containing sensor protein
MSLFLYHLTQHVHPMVLLTGVLLITMALVYVAERQRISRTANDGERRWHS